MFTRCWTKKLYRTLIINLKVFITNVPQLKRNDVTVLNTYYTWSDGQKQIRKGKRRDAVEHCSDGF